MAQDVIASVDPGADAPLKCAEEPRSMVGFFSLFRGVSGSTKLLMVLACLCAAIDGATLPLFTTLFSETIDKFGDLEDSDRLNEEVTDLVINFLYLAAVAFVAGSLHAFLWRWVALRQGASLRRKYLRSTLHQDISYFDADTNSGTLMNGMSEDILRIEVALGGKLSSFLQAVSTLVFGLIISLYNAWEVTLLMAAVLPFLGIGIIVMMKVGGQATKSSDEAGGSASQSANEAVVNVRTVAAFNAQDTTVKKYEASLASAVKVAVWSNVIFGLGIGLVFLFLFSVYGVSFLFGAWRVRQGERDGGEILGAIFGVIVGAMSLGQAMPSLPAFVAARVAGARVFSLIERTPPIDITAPGDKPHPLKGDLQLENVQFTYPTRPDQMVFKAFNLTVPAGSTAALVGSSGSGKSTVVSLVMRFYDPDSGRVTVGGRDLRSFDLGWYRDQLGLVSQEPTLFAATVAENIGFGRPGATRSEIEEAARAANAHNFILKLPQGYDTDLGARGDTLSGGQRQRLAIARAVLKDPAVLLLDEATSALDTRSERVVQAALERLMVGRTTVIVAHRLSTVRGADSIAVVREGAVVEEGRHEELIKRSDGAYYTLVKLQLQATDEDGVADMEADALLSLKDGEDDVVDELPAEKAAGKGAQAEDVPGKKEKKKGGGAPMSKLLAMNKTEWPFLALGALSSIVLGAIMPAFALLMASIIAVFYEEDNSKAKRDATLWSSMFFVAGAAWFLGCLGQQYGFGVAGHNLVKRLRVLMLSRVLHQEMAFFDREENNSGAILSQLGEDTLHIRGAVGDRVGSILQALTSVAFGLGIGFFYSWKLTLVVLGTFPFMAAAGSIQQKVIMSTGKDGDGAWAGATAASGEAIRSIRTVQAFNMQRALLDKFDALVASKLRRAAPEAAVLGVGFGLSNAVMFLTYALCFWYGARLVEDGDIGFENMLKAFLGIVFSALGLAQVQLMFPDLAKAGPAAERVFGVINRRPAIDASASGGHVPPRLTRAAISLKEVTFRYPSRPEVAVFEAFNLDVEPAACVALVGESGSGKSTVVALVERLYDPEAGVVALNADALPSLDVRWLRDQVGLVSQEPQLMSSSILDNIKLGAANATMEQVEAAARAANAHDFIAALPTGYNTVVGEGGLQLSGGQRQRVAIARAVVREPAVLLLDEATSALDAASESLVQAALDEVMRGRTTLVIAHRLSTVRNADVIAVVQDGTVLERGSHAELLQNADGAYTQLIKAQMGSRSMKNISAAA